ncbi:MAG: hypothetical protein IJX17_08280 [Clostridia bacterium]|nr:hypothetical protein [Clostridia bacterium]
MKRYYDADYIIRKNNEYEEERIYNSPVEVKLRQMIESATIACNLQNEKCRKQKEKLEARKREKKLLAEQEAYEREM